MDLYFIGRMIAVLVGATLLFTLQAVYAQPWWLAVGTGVVVYIAIRAAFALYLARTGKP